jgi:hypothetical protein
MGEHELLTRRHGQRGEGGRGDVRRKGKGNRGSGKSGQHRGKLPKVAVAVEVGGCWVGLILLSAEYQQTAGQSPGE